MAEFIRCSANICQMSYKNLSVLPCQNIGKMLSLLLYFKGTFHFAAAPYTTMSYDVLFYIFTVV